MAFYSLAGVQAAIGAAQSARSTDRGYQFLVFEGDRLVGRVNLHEVRRPYFNAADLGYRIGEQEIGRGIASRAVALCLAQAFGAIGLSRIEATVRSDNARSMHVLDRSGFAVFGRSTRSLLRDGQWFDRVHFERHADDGHDG